MIPYGKVQMSQDDTKADIVAKVKVCLMNLNRVVEDDFIRIQLDEVS